MAFFATANTVKGALECVKQVLKRPLGDHDPKTRDFLQRVGNDLEARSRGEECTTALAKQVKVIKNSSLDETPGEGIHRGTNHEKTRAPSASSVHLKQKIRVKGVVKTLRGFCKQYGEPGQAVVRYEWEHYGRILQSCPRYRWRPKRMQLISLLKRVYREDAMAQEAWSAILSRVPLERPVEPEAAHAREPYEREYLQSVLRPGGRYCVDREVTGMTEAGTENTTTKRDYFQIVAVVNCKSRDHEMHTVFSADDVARTASLAMEVQVMDRWTLEGDVGDGGVTRVYAEADPEWLVPHRIATFDDFVNRLWKFERVEPDPENSSCVLWSGCVRGKPDIPLMDARCPTAILLLNIQNQGWYNKNRTGDASAL